MTSTTTTVGPTVSTNNSSSEGVGGEGDDAAAGASMRRLGEVGLDLSMQEQRGGRRLQAGGLGGGPRPGSMNVQNPAGDAL